MNLYNIYCRPFGTQRMVLRLLEWHFTVLFWLGYELVFCLLWLVVSEMSEIKTDLGCQDLLGLLDLLVVGIKIW